MSSGSGVLIDCRKRHSSAARVFILYMGIITLLSVQVTLVFSKAINWDEFFHFSQIYELKAGTLTRDLQVIHARLFAWTPLVSDNVVEQIQISRLVMLGCEILALWAIIGLAQCFVEEETAILAAFLYLTAGYVLFHGFSFRPDPMATAVLMTALYLMAAKKLSYWVIVLTGVLIGVAGVMTVKSVFYAPCFAGVALMRLLSASDKTNTFAKLAALPVIAGVAFFLLFQWHRLGLPVSPSVNGSIGQQNRFFELFQFTAGKFTLVQLGTAPVLTAAAAISPWIWKRLELPHQHVVALSGLFMPLISLAVYRNTFPYFFVFLLAPVVIAAAPAFQWLKKRYGLWPVVGVASISPLVMFMIEPRDVVARQHELINEVRRLYPEPTPYLSYSGIVADYPRIVDFLLFGVGQENYYRNNVPTIARAIEAGAVGFVIADAPPARDPRTYDQLSHGLLPEDKAALRQNFIHFAGPMWLAGKTLCAAGAEQDIRIVRAGPYTLDGERAVIDGQTIRFGETVTLSRGNHSLFYNGRDCAKLWAMPSIPRPSSTKLGEGPIMSGF